TPAAEPSRASRPEPDTGTHRGGRGAAQQHALRANGLPPAHSEAGPDDHLRSPGPASACAVGEGGGGRGTVRGKGIRPVGSVQRGWHACAPPTSPPRTAPST